jgi:peptide/nickel transport system substrate-binding protein
VNERRRRLDAVRTQRTPLENHVIDEYLGGRISRRSFMQRAALVGISAPLVTFLAACGGDDGDSAPATTAGGGATTTAGSTDTTASSGGGAAGGLGTLKVGGAGPSASIDPVMVGDLGGLIVLYQVGDYLTFSGSDLVLRPGIAESWTPNADGTEWTFKIRQGVKFHDGTVLTAKDVVATFDRLADPEMASNALSVFKGVLSKGNITSSDDATVVFKLDGPNSNFPYLVSTDNYNAIILKADYAGDFETNAIGTGPWKLESYTPQQGAVYVANPDYYGEKAKFDKVEFTFYDDEAALVQALQAGSIDIAHAVSISGAAPLAGSDSYSNSKISSTAHRQLHMRTDMEPFTDKRTRQAMGLLLDRPAIIGGLFDGFADLGNDSPFAPVYPTTDKSVAQRAKDLTQAKQLLEATGQAGGFTVQLNAIQAGEVPDYAVIVQNAAKEAGITLDVVVQDAGEFYGDAVFGSSPWLDATMGIVDYGHRGVPNVFLNAPLVSEGTWNSAHFKNTTYDGLVKDFEAALDIDSQKQVAKQIQELLLDETPIIFAYFFNYLSWSKKDVTGYNITGMGQISLNTVTK